MAPRLLPPALITSVLVSKILMKLTGPDATPLVDITISPFGLRCEKSKPTPPPLFSIIAMFFAAVKMPSSESATGKTKHADSCPSGVPALNRVGVFGTNSSFEIISPKIFSLRSGLPLNFASGCAMAFATLLKSSGGVSMICSFTSLRRYLCFRTSRALTVSLGSPASSFPLSLLSSIFFCL